jgi:hypothetical protein
MTDAEIHPLSHYQLRTTGEPVFVIEQMQATSRWRCIRPTQSQALGLNHTEYTAFAEELETPETAIKREIDQIIFREKYAVAQQTALTASSAPQLVKPN